MACFSRQIPEPHPDRSRDVLAENVVLSLSKAFNTIQQDLLHLFKKYGSTSQQYNVLRILYVRGEHGLCNTEIAALMINRIPDMTRLIDRMERDGLLKRIRSEEDRRMVRIFLLDKGRELCQKIDQPLLDSQKNILSNLSDEEQKLLNTLLNKI